MMTLFLRVLSCVAVIGFLSAPQSAMALTGCDELLAVYDAKPGHKGTISAQMWACLQERARADGSDTKGSKAKETPKKVGEVEENPLERWERYKKIRDGLR